MWPGRPALSKPVPAIPSNLAKRGRVLDPSDPWFLRLASHWPNKMKLFGKNPRNCGAKPLECAPDQTDYWSFVTPTAGVPELTTFGRRVAGLD